MEFNPNNPVIQLCMQGMAQEEQGQPEEAGELFLRAWNETTNDFEKYLAAYYVARQQKNIANKLSWYKTALEFALKVNDDAVSGALATLYSLIAGCYESLGDLANAKKHQDLATTFRGTPADKGPFYHGTRADLQPGDFLTPGRTSNYKPGLQMNHIYFTALANGAGLAAELAKGTGRERVYIVEPTGDFENDPNVTDKKFPGNPTRSYRTSEPLKITGEVTDWVRQTPEQLQQWLERLVNSKGEIIN
nr:NAD(+)--rifampin ADP-ribosyltransferase [uncultured Mucilaginibacter sp.]